MNGVLHSLSARTDNKVMDLAHWNAVLYTFFLLQ